MNRSELLQHYYNEYSTRLLKNYVSKLSKNKESILEFSEIKYHKTKENFLIKFEIVDKRGRGRSFSYLDILYKVIDLHNHRSLRTFIRMDDNDYQNLDVLYHKFKDEELNQMLENLR